MGDAYTRMVAAIGEQAFKGSPGDTVQDDALLSRMQRKRHQYPRLVKIAQYQPRYRI
jgi:hypothetical protein